MSKILCYRWWCILRRWYQTLRNANKFNHFLTSYYTALLKLSLLLPGLSLHHKIGSTN
ncbi:unnamed protein product [Brugia timori]|uniref:Uncharacterized protein n=1 Tax=Brugia timori TaxID=42155 RepID=A0A0R3RDF4_9BILA|nr:unnamed protein product [Brugia timori]